MTSFICKKCGVEKDAANFYKHSAMATGYLSQCKDCVKARVGRHREENIDAVRAYDRERGGLPHRKEAVKARAPKYKHLRTERVRKSRQKYPEKYIARNILNAAIRDGKIIKPEICERCRFPGNLHGHHDDYSKPMEVQWLCASCHGKLHKERGDLKRT